MSVKNNSGTWTNSEPININGVQHALVNGAAEPTAVTVATADGTQYEQTLNPGGLYEFVTYNFRGEASGITMYGVNTVDNGFSYDGTTFIKIKTGMETDTPEHVALHISYIYFSPIQMDLYSIQV